MRKKLEWKWEELECSADGAIQSFRIQVIGGWLVKCITQNVRAKSMSESMVFVPDSDHNWQISKPVEEKVVLPESQF